MAREAGWPRTIEGKHLDRRPAAGEPAHEELGQREVPESRRAGEVAVHQRRQHGHADGQELFDLDALACPRCGGRLRVIATVQDPLAVQAILAHLARARAPAPPGPAPPAPAALT